MYISLVMDLRSNAGLLPFPVGYLLRELSESSVESVGGTKMRTVDQVVASLWVLDQPGRVKRGVVPDDVDDTQHTPVLLNRLDYLTHLDVARVHLELLADTFAVCKGGRCFGVGLTRGEVGGVDPQLVRDRVGAA